MVGADSSVSVNDQVIRYIALVAIWFLNFRYHG